MDTELTDITQETSEGEGADEAVNTDVIEGAGEVPAEQTKSFTQKDVDEIIKNRLAEARKRHEKEFNKTLADKLSEKEAELEQRVGIRVKETLAAQEIRDTKAAIAKEYGLNDAQIARLQGVSADELKADAESIYGVLKKNTPPPVNPGGKEQPSNEDAIAAAIKEGLSKLKF